jgi:hypothetical protein
MTMDRRHFLTTAGRATIALGSVPLWPAVAAPCLATRGRSRRRAVVTDLAGTWRFRLNPTEMGREFGAWFSTRLPAEIALPGTTDEAGVGPRDHGVRARSPHTRPSVRGLRLVSAGHRHPRDLAGQAHHALSRTRHWATTVWLDDAEIGTQNSLSTPHLHDLSAATPGKHQLTIRVDNRYLLDVGRDAHSVTDHTQTNWNGIVGRIELRATDPVWIDGVRLFPECAPSGPRRGHRPQHDGRTAECDGRAGRAPAAARARASHA